MTELQKIMPITWWGMTGLLLFILILMIISTSLYRRMKKFEVAHHSLKTYMSGKSVDALIEENLESVDKVSKQVGECLQRIEKSESKLRLAVDRVEMVRFSAFENMGSELSFAVAMLNQYGNGIVLSSINNRDESRVYAKPVVAGKSSYNLSEEEKGVIAKAMISENV